MRVVRWADRPQQAVMESVLLLKEGKCVVYPTDTIYGIAADPMRDECVKLVNRIKGREEDEPISICIPSLEWLEERVDKELVKKARGYLPGPYTLLLPVKERIAVMGRSKLLGVRMVQHPYVEAIVERFGPITSTSANAHDMPPPKSVSDAMAQLRDRADLYIDAGETGTGRPSTIISFVGGEAKVIRQ
jgi:L-threonylcarbamoyladenylate synthase